MRTRFMCTHTASTSAHTGGSGAQGSAHASAHTVRSHLCSHAQGFAEKLKMLAAAAALLLVYRRARL